MEKIDLSEFNYILPNHKISAFPESDRSSSKLLVYKNNSITSSHFKNILEHLPENSLLCMNETKVIHARIFFQNSTGAKIEILCLEPVNPKDYALNLSNHHSVIWKTLVGNKKKWKNEVLTISFEDFVFTAEKLNNLEEEVLVNFSWNNPNLSFAEILEKIGHIPLPPYLKREDTKEDANTYQTVFAKNQGSVAAPTAGIHFTQEILNDLPKKNIEIAKMTLHVGAGTFKPIKSSDISEHQMHSEFFYVERQALDKLIHAIRNKKPIIALGTTVARTIETLYWLGLNPGHHLDQWIPYQTKATLNPEESLRNLLDYLKKKNLNQIEGNTSLLITPNYSFKMVDALITNFHQPESTLLLLVAALVGEDWKKIYEFALNNEFRFLSYGDGSILFRKD
jgi:S-adenosylmethionine:tRNA ribosyltransferase-isomerase